MENEKMTLAQFSVAVALDNLSSAVKLINIEMKAVENAARKLDSWDFETVVSKNCADRKEIIENAKSLHDALESLDWSRK
jgi:hypothetical protein